jgi:hypothetical protein
MHGGSPVATAEGDGEDDEAGDVEEPKRNLEGAGK